MNTRNKIDIMIEPTNRCNLRCPTCFSHQDRRKKRDMPFGEFKKIVDQNFGIIRNMSLYNYGEPFLNSNLCRMISYAKENGVEFIKVTTNGMFLDRDSIINLLHSGLDYLSISLDGATSGIYSQFRIGGDFRRVVSNIANLVGIRNELNNNLKIEVQFIIMRHNEHQVKLIKNMARRLKVDILRLKTVLIKRSEWNFLLPETKKYNRYIGLDNKRKNFCFKPLEELVINSDGTVIPCCYIVGKDIARFKLGNVLKTTLCEIINSNSYRNFVKNCTAQKYKLSCCASCEEGNLPLNFKLIRLNDG